MEDQRRSSLQERMSRNVLQSSVTHTNRIIAEPKLTTEDSMIQRLVQEKKQLVQEHSHQMLYREQRIKTLENEISIMGIKYQRLRKDYEEVVEGGNAEIIEELKMQNEGVIQKINQTEGMLEYVMERVAGIVGEGVEQREQGVGEGSVSSLGQSLFVEARMDELEKRWRQRGEHVHRLGEKLEKTEGELASRQAEIKLLNQHLAQSQSLSKKMKTTISTLQRVLQSAQSEKKRILAESTFPLPTLTPQNSTQPQLKKLISKLLARERDLSSKNQKLLQQIYIVKEQSTLKLESALEKIGKIKEQKDLEISRLGRVIGESKIC